MDQKLNLVMVDRTALSAALNNITTRYADSETLTSAARLRLLGIRNERHETDSGFMVHSMEYIQFHIHSME
jgi:hypothetical protein